MERLAIKCKALTVACQLCLQFYWLTITAQANVDNPSGRNFVNQAAQLLNALYLVPVDAHNYVVLFDSSLSSGSVLVNHSDFDALLVFQMQWSQSVGSDVASINAKIRSTACRFVA